MDHAPFYKTRGGEKFLFKTVPDLTRQLERLSDGVAQLVDGQRDPAVQELISYAPDLADAVERVLDVEIVPGNPKTIEAFDLLRANAAAMRRILAKLGKTRS